jgi:hypothetical protein
MKAKEKALINITNCKRFQDLLFTEKREKGIHMAFTI